MEQYRLLQKKGDGTFSQVFKAKCLKTGQEVAIKCMKKKYETLKTVAKLNEIQALKLLSEHQNIVKLIEVLYDQPSGKLALVFELMEINLYECIVKSKNISLNRIKYYMYQLLRAIEYIHRKSIFHRDIKPENVLLSGDSIKLADFGSCKGIYTSYPYTEYISTRWYRAPQCLMTDGYYDQKMDIWGYGCVFFQMISKIPLFAGRNQMDQIHRIIKILGSPSESLLQTFKKNATHINAKDWNFPTSKGISFGRLLPNTSKDLIDLLQKLIVWDPKQRISADEALRHQFFADINEALKNNQFRSTIFGLPSTSLQNRLGTKEEQSPSKNKNKKLKKQSSKGVMEEESAPFPPIHNFRLDVNLNLYGATSKPNDNIFKKTNIQIHRLREKDDHFKIIGKKC